MDSHERHESVDSNSSISWKTTTMMIIIIIRAKQIKLNMVVVYHRHTTHELSKLKHFVRGSFIFVKAHYECLRVYDVFPFGF